MSVRSVQWAMAPSRMEMIGAAVTVAIQAGGQVETRATEPVRVAAEELQYQTARPDWVWQVTLLVEDVGTDLVPGDSIAYHEGPHADQTWIVSDLPLNAVDGPYLSAVVRRGV